MQCVLRARFSGEARGQNLDRDVSIETRVSGPIHFAHAAGANGRFDLIRAQPGARRQVHGAANYNLGTTQRTGRIPICKCGEGWACRTPFLECEHGKAPAHRRRIVRNPEMRSIFGRDKAAGGPLDDETVRTVPQQESSVGLLRHPYKICA